MNATRLLQRDRPDRVLVLMQGATDRELLVERLGDEFDVVTAAPHEEWDRFDLVVVDTGTYRSVRDALTARKVAAAPTFLPVLLLVSEREYEAAHAELDGTTPVDDLLLVPSTERIISTRVRSLLHSRHLSMELDEERRRFVTLAESATDAIVVVEADGTVRYANPAIERIFGYDPEAIEGRSITDLMPERYRDEHEFGVARYLRTGERQVDWSNVAFTGLHADGHEVPIEVSLAEFEETDEHLFTGIVRDVTERHERQAELEEARNRLELSLRGSDLAVWEFDVRTEEVTVHTPQTKHLDIGDQYGSDRFVEAVHPEDREELFETLEATLSDGQQFDQEVRVGAPTGGYIWLELTGDLYTREEMPTRILGTAKDVTERKERTEELERTTDLLEKTQALADVGGWEYDLQTGTVEWTAKGREIHGHTGEDDLGIEAALDIYHDEDRPAVREALDRAASAGETFDLEVRIVRDGEVRWVHAQGEPVFEDGEVVTLRGAVQDVTGRRELEDTLREETQLLERIFDASPVGVTVLDDEGNIVRANRAAEEVIGLTREQITDRTYASPDWELFDEDGDPIPPETLPYSRVMETGEPVFGVEHGVRHVDGEERWLSINAAPLTDEDGEPVGVVAVVQDVTERRERQRQLEASERRFRAVFEGAKDAMVIADDDGEYVAANPAAAELFGVDREDLIGRTIAEFAPEDYDFEGAWEAFFRGEQVEGEFPLVRPDGTVRSTLFSATPNVLPGRHLSVLRDVTDLIEHQQRLSVLDRVLRHNIRNKLNIVLAQAKQIGEVEDERISQSAASVVEAAESLLGMSESARRFQSTIRPDDEVATLDVSELVGNVVEETRLNHPGATVVAEIPPSVRVRAHPSFELAVSELVENAVVHDPDDHPTVRVDVVDRPGAEVVEVRVADRGPGLPKMERSVFERGEETALEHMTGLGLWLVRWTVENSNGTVTVEENDPEGTVLVVRLQRADG